MRPATEPAGAGGGTAGAAGSIEIHDAQFAWHDPAAGNPVYELGDVAPIQVTIVNDTTSAVAGGSRPTRLRVQPDRHDRGLRQADRHGRPWVHAAP